MRKFMRCFTRLSAQVPLSAHCCFTFRRGCADCGLFGLFLRCRHGRVTLRSYWVLRARNEETSWTQFLAFGMY
jgi:hypothetical protein